MKIAFLNLKPLSHKGGAEKWIGIVCNLLREQGDEVVVLVPSDRAWESDISGCKHIFYKSRIHTLFEKLGFLNLFPPFLNVTLPDDIDVIYVPTVHPLLLFRSVVKQKKKLLIGTHDLFIPNRTIGIDIYQKISLMGINFLARKGIVIIHSLNPMTTKAFEGSMAKVVEVGNEFLSGNFLNNRNVTGEELDAETNRPFRVLFIGNIEPRKGSKLMLPILDSFKSMYDILFIFAGKVLDKRLINDLNHIPINAVFKGTISEEEKSLLLSVSDVFLFLSDREASPIVIEEAFSYGLPIVSTWEGVKQLKSSKLAVFSVPERTVNGVKKSILDFYTLWRKDRAKFYADKNVRSSIYDNHFVRSEFEERITSMFRD